MLLHSLVIVGFVVLYWIVTAACAQVGADEVSEAVKLAQQLLRSESSTTIGEIQNGRGFKTLNIAGSFKQSEVKSQDKEKLINSQLESPAIFSLIDDESMRSRVREALRDFLYEVSSQLHEYSIIFRGNKGSMYMLRIRAITDPRNGNYHYGRVIFKSEDFELAPDFVVVTETESDFFSSSSQQRIVYIPRSFTNQDAVNLLKFFSVALHSTSMLIDTSSVLSLPSKEL